MTEQRPAETPDSWIRRDHLYLAIIVGLLPGVALAGVPIWAFAAVGAVCAIAALTVRLTEPRREPCRLDTFMLVATFAGGGVGGSIGAKAAGALGGASAGAVTALLGVVTVTAINHWLRQRRTSR